MTLAQWFQARLTYRNRLWSESRKDKSPDFRARMDKLFFRNTLQMQHMIVACPPKIEGFHFICIPADTSLTALPPIQENSIGFDIDLGSASPTRLAFHFDMPFGPTAGGIVTYFPTQDRFIFRKTACPVEGGLPLFAPEAEIIEAVRQFLNQTVPE